MTTQSSTQTPPTDSAKAEARAEVHAVDDEIERLYERRRQLRGIINHVDPIQRMKVMTHEAMEGANGWFLMACVILAIFGAWSIVSEIPQRVGAFVLVALIAGMPLAQALRDWFWLTRSLPGQPDGMAVDIPGFYRLQPWYERPFLGLYPDHVPASWVV